MTSTSTSTSSFESIAGEYCDASNRHGRQRAFGEWFGWYFDQGLMPRAQLLNQLRGLAEKISPDSR